MKRIIVLFFSIMAVISAFAFDFTGKTFRGTSSMNGTKVTITYRFKANNRLSSTLSVQGQKPLSDNGMHWEISGDFINIFDSTGDMTYMHISESDGKTVLIAFDSYGKEAMVFKQVPTSSTPKKKK